MAEYPTEKADRSLPVQRLAELLHGLELQGVTQSQVARRTLVPRQYVSDVVNGRRPLTELFARRLGDEFNRNYQWLMGKEDSPVRVALPSPASSSERVWIPLIDESIAGDPREHPRWNGACIDLSGPAAMRAARAIQPYVLQLPHGDREGRVSQGDLLLVSQVPAEQSELSVVRHEKDILLARKTAAKWLRVDTGKPLSGDLQPVGHCLGIVWSALA
jgi:transcriptional regulator with XRE-family HTH domain